jgi:ribose transport system permease protein
MIIMSISKSVGGIASKIFAVKESGIILPTILFIVIISLVNPVFLSANNVFNVLRSTGFTLITALGMTLVLILQGLDLSVGSVLALGGCVSGIAMSAYHLPIFPAIIAGCAAGFIIGLVNGLVIIKFRIPPLIITLGMMYMARGIVYIITKGVPVYPLSQEFQAIEQQDVFGIPKIVIISIILSVITHIFLTHTTIGRSIYAVGGNKEAANLSGINMKKINVICYAVCGTLAATTGVIMASRLGSAQPSAGTSYEMTVIAAVIIGGTSTSGGSGTILGTVIGALFMNILSNAMTIMKVSVYWQNFVIGFVLVLAVILDQIKKDRMLLAGIKARD